jgi:hypothetical protein
MKRKILASILGVAAMAAATTSFGQGKINLNNYANTGNQILYGANIAGGTTGAGIVGNGQVPTWTIGFYYALGDVSASVAADGTGTKDPSTLGGSLGFATGAPGDTTTITAGNGKPGGGYFSTPGGDAIINGWSSGSITLEVVAYSGADYGSSAFRGHSAAFLMTPIASTALQGAPQTSPAPGAGMPGFSVFAVPEPSTFALAGLGAAALMAFRRKKA